MALAALSHRYGETFVESILKGSLHGEYWSQASKAITDYGLLGMAAISLSPFPQQPAVALCGLAHLSVPMVGLAVALGRAPKYYAFAYGATHAPRLFGKLWKRLGFKPIDPSSD